MLSDSYNLYWGDAHTNLRPYAFDQFPESFAAARDLLDFWAIAYYAFAIEDVNVFYPYEDPETLQELYDHLRKVEGLAIPHHTETAWLIRSMEELLPDMLTGSDRATILMAPTHVLDLGRYR